MIRRLLVVLVLVAVSVFGWAKPRELTTFSALMDALKGGYSVRAVYTYREMTLDVDGETVAAPDAIGGKEISDWEWFAAGLIRNPRAYVAFSETTLIAHPSHGHVQNYVRTRVYEDGTVEITARYLKGPNLEIVMDETFRGKIGAGNGARFFADE